MKIVKVLIPLVALAAACGEAPVPAAPELNVAAAKAPAGGVGNAKFDELNTRCTFNDIDVTTGEQSGLLNCSYKMTGLGKNGAALVTMVGLVKTTWDCVAPASGEVVRSGRNEMRLALSFDVWGDQSGNAKGTMSAVPIDLTPILNCGVEQVGTEQRRIFGRLVTFPVFALTTVANVRYELDSVSTTDGEPTVTGQWALFAMVKTGKSSFLSFYGGAL